MLEATVEPLTECTPQKVVFLKVHKAAGTFLKGLLVRYGERHNFTMTLSGLSPF